MSERLLLASQSARRRELLWLLGLPFDAVAPDVEESQRPGEKPAELVARLAAAKAQAVAVPADRPSAAIVACDTIVALDGEVLGKPRDPADAERMLRRLRGREHFVYSGIALREPATDRTVTEVVETVVRMREYDDAEVAAYVASGDPLDKAGGYAVQNAAFHPVAGLEGCYANVMGLPLCHLARLLRGWGIAIPNDVPTVCQAHTGWECRVYAALWTTP